MTHPPSSVSALLHTARRDSLTPLSSPQREIWFDQMVHADMPLYNIGGYMHLAGPLNVALFMQAIPLLVRKHDVLRTVISVQDDPNGDALPMQTFAEALPDLCDFLDMSSHDDPHASAMAWMQQRFAQPFALRGEPLFRMALLKLSNEAHVYFACYHHLIADGWTVALLTRSHAEIYTALQNGEAPDITAPSYNAFIDNDRCYAASDAFEAQRQYWLDKFQSLPEPLLSARAAGHAKESNQSPPCACSRLHLPRAWYNALSAFAREHNATTFHAILAAVTVYFARITQRTELIVGLPVLNRSNAAFKATAGLFVSMTAARLQIDDQASFAGWMTTIGRELKRDYRHQRFPISALNRELGRMRGQHSSLFDIGLSYERHDYEAAFGQVRGTAIPMINAHQTTPLMLYVREFHDDAPVQIDFVYNKAYFTDEEIGAIQQRLVHLLESAQQMPASPVDSLPLLTPHEAAQIQSWNQTRRTYADDRSLLNLVAKQVAQRPDHPAVVVGERTLSYRQLDEASNRLARYLRERHHIQPDTRVALCLERSPEMLIAILAVLKAGGAYVPLHPATPRERIRRVLHDARVPVLLTQQQLSARLAASTAYVVCIDAELETIANYASTPLEDNTHAAHLAYVIYTSGSTGEPKGVMVSRGNLLHSTRARLDTHTEPVERFLMLSSFAFDSSVAGIFWTLCSGGTLCLPTEQEHNDSLAIVRLIERHAISHLLCIPSFHALLLEAASVWQLASLSTVIVAGEACGAELVERHYSMLPNTALFNEYGPTEASVWSTVHRCESLTKQPAREAALSIRVVPIGRPISNVQIHLLDRHLEPVPVGVAAEVYISGEGVTRGYLSRPEATAEKFLPCPFSGTPGARMYKSGDLARWLPDGSIEYLGRIDHQVKHRGFRIELTEIEAALLSLPAVREAAVLAREDSPGHQRVVAYVVLQNGVLSESAHTSALKDALRSLLPPHMVPDHILLLPHMPLTPNGKVDRKALPAPQERSAQEDHIAPRTTTERMLADIWRDLLQCHQVGLRDNFFALGGHSLLGAQCVARIRKLVSVEVPLRVMFDKPVLQDLAQHIEALIGDTDGRPNVLSRPTRVDRTQELPLSFAQQRLWFLDQMESGNAFYNMAGGLRLTGMLNVSALQAAIHLLIERHEVLRTGFEARDGDPVQIVFPRVPTRFSVTDLTTLPPEKRLTEARRLTEREASRSFDLQQPPLLRTHLLRLDVDEHWLVLNMHHAVADGWSMPLLMRDLAACYRAEATQIRTPLPALPLQYADFAVWQRQLANTPQWQTELRYWRDQLADAPALLELPTDHARPARQSYRGAQLAFTLPDGLVTQLHALSREHGATLFMTLLGAFGLLLSRTSGQEDLCIGTPIANRQHAEFDNLIGCFVNTLVMRLQPTGELAFSDYLQQVRETALGAYAHQNVPFEQVVDSLQITRDLSHAPLFQVMFALHQAAAQHAGPNELVGLTTQPLELALPVAKFDLTLNLHEDTSEDSPGLRSNIEYNTDLFEAATISRMIDHFRTLLESIVAQPAAPVATLNMLTSEERSFLLEELNRTEQAFPLHASYASLFAEQVARYPDRIVAVCMDECFTYRELDERSTRIARALVAAGAGPEVLVGVLGERSLCFLTTMIAIFKAGAVYVPLDVNHPASRLRDIVERSRMPLMLAAEDSLPLLDPLLSGLTAPPRALVAEALWLKGDASPLPLVGTPDDLAYVIFTSGSTGRPKGAMVEHRGMLNNLYGKVPALGLGPDDRVAQTASPAFDISVWQCLAAPLLGGTVHILPDAVAHDPQRLLDEVAAQEITVLQVVPSMMRRLVQASADTLQFALRWVLSIGEALPPDLALTWFARFPAIPLINIYGPAECADNVAFLALCNAQEAEAYRDLASVPIGRPTANNQLFILDANLQPVPVGVTGEICVAGAGVGRGYLNDPDTSAAAFVPHPFMSGARFYRTGDLGRYRTDGTIDYLGRRDHQVKIRGHRIELGEIESRLRACAGVHDAAVIARKDRHGEMEIVACWVRSATDEENHAINAEQLRRALAAHLPHSMIPGHFVMLDKLPVNANGKIDRKALAAMPLQEERPVDRQIDTPSTATEQALHNIWAALLEHVQIGRDHNFFHLGGHSLLATQVMARVRSQFGCELPLRTIFEAPTLRELAARIDEHQHQAQETSTHEPALLPVERSTPLPLSFSQQRLWFLDQLEPGTALYNMPGVLRLRGELDAEVLQSALNDLVARHEVLRTAFDTIDGATVQCIADAAEVPFSLHDLSALPSAQRKEQARRLAAEEAQRPFDLRNPPMLRAQLLRLNAKDHWLLLTMHHIAGDAWSTGIVLRELAAFYRARCSGTPPYVPALPTLPVQYADYAVWQRARLQEPMRERQLAYWRDQLAGAPALLDLPTDHPRPAVQSTRGGRITLEIDPALTNALHALCRETNTTLFMTLCASFALVLARYSGQHDICIGTPVTSRQRQEVENLIGFFVNTLVLRLKIDGEHVFHHLLQQTRETALAAYAHQDLPFEQLVEALQPERHRSHAPLFQVMFVLENAAPDTSTWHEAALQVEPMELDLLPTARFDLTLHITEQSEGLQARFEYNADLFERETIARLGRYFQQLLHAIVTQPQTAVAELPLLSEPERQQLLVEWNRTSSALPPHPTIHAMFEACVQAHPDRIAVVFQEQQLTYAELNSRANRLAHALRARGVGPDELVGICAERSLEMIIAVFAVLKAGGAYLPLDPAIPAARMATMLDDAQPCLVLTQSHLLARLPRMEPAPICLDAQSDLFTDCSDWSDENPSPHTRPDHLAYVIYTSGSTGKPKGTLIHHRGLVNLVQAQQQAFDLHPGTRVLQWASFNFDVSVSDIFTALTSGAQLYLASSEAVLPGQNLLDTLREHRIELVALTVSSLAAMPVESLPDLKTIVVGGEHCDLALIAPWVKRYTVINAYGPTEATVCATVYPCSADGKRHPPIGRPLANTQIYILDAYLNPVPIGVTGELYIGGEGLARGYLGRPDLTAERFIQNPYSEQPGARMYRTGDLARYLPDGHIEYVGRIDHQIKIRGYRIELGEVEFALTQLPLVQEAVVLAQDAPAGGKRLVAYVAPSSGNGVSVTASQLHAALQTALPDYMVPSHFMLLDRLPVNTNGKIDRVALNALEWVEDELHYVAPETATEQRLAALWSELLARERVGRDEHFFHIGGHSLLAVRMMARIKQDFGYALPLSQLFLMPTIATLAAAIDERKVTGQLVVPMTPVTALQQSPLWLIHPAGGTVFCYRKLSERWHAACHAPVQAIQSPEIAGLDWTASSFDALCVHYAGEILRIQPEGAVHLAGWSMGGAIAFRIAELLEQQGRTVAWVGLFDTMLARGQAALGFEEFVIWAFTRLHSELFTTDNAMQGAQARIRNFLAEHGASALVERLVDDPDWMISELGLDASHVAFLRRQHALQQAHIALMNDVVPGRVRAPLHVFCAEESLQSGMPQVDWLAHTDTAQQSTREILPGHHDNVILLEYNIERIVQVLATAMQGKNG